MASSNLLFKGYRAEEIVFNLNNKNYKEQNINREDNLKIEIGVGQNDKQFAVKMTYDEKNINNCYDLKVVLVGHYEIKEDVSETIDNYAPNAVAILFPYLRATITSITTAAGVPPLIMPIMNFTQLD